jgi:4,5-dihydroxyphthalate decarboxylase
MIDHRAWDACELSLSSYIMAKARGAALTALPVFPRRLYSQSQMYVNTEAGIHGPPDLVGKRVGLRSFQTTLSVLAKGDLQHKYDVPLDQVTWVTSTDEPVPFDPPAGVCIERIPADKNIETLLVQGEIQADIVPRMPRPFVQGVAQVADSSETVALRRRPTTSATASTPSCMCWP